MGRTTPNTTSVTIAHKKQSDSELEVPILGLERKFSIERPPETGEQETK
jgi:hypothetical protein